MTELKQSCQINSKQSTVFLLYSRYWHFCKYYHKYSKEKVEKDTKYFYERLIEEYTLNQWQFHYLEWTIEKMKKLEPMVDPPPFIFRQNPPNGHLVHLSDCFNLFYHW